MGMLISRYPAEANKTDTLPQVQDAPVAAAAHALALLASAPANVRVLQIYSPAITADILY